MTTADRWPRVRALADRPEIRELKDNRRQSQLFILALVATDVAVAWVVHKTSWVVAFALAVRGGKFFAQALDVLIHDCSHNLVARGVRANKLWMIVANLPLLAPVAIELRAYHLRATAPEVGSRFTFDGYLALNCAAQTVGCIALYEFVGFEGLSFLGISAAIALAPHLVGAQQCEAPKLPWQSASHAATVHALR